MKPSKLIENRRKVLVVLAIVFSGFLLVSGYYYSGSNYKIEIEVVNMTGEDRKADRIWLKFYNREGEEIRGVLRTVSKYSGTYGTWREESSEDFLIELGPGETITSFKSDNKFADIPNDTWFKVTFSGPEENWWATTDRLRSEKYMK